MPSTQQSPCFESLAAPGLLHDRDGRVAAHCNERALQRCRNHFGFWFQHRLHRGVLEVRPDLVHPDADSTSVHRPDVGTELHGPDWPLFALARKRVWGPLGHQ
eukprot:6114977-Heterocapsa_arctica.AAC.1